MAQVKLVVFAPKSHADVIRKALGDAGAGRIGNYSHNSFTLLGTGRWLPLKGAKPYAGKVGKLSEEKEEPIEYVCDRKSAKTIIQAVRKVHPYETVAFDIYPLISEEEL